MAAGDVARTLSHARRALDLVDEGDHLGRGTATGFLGLVHWTTGELEVAHGFWATSTSSLQMAGYAADSLGTSIAMADIRIAQGRLQEAMTTYERGLSLATERGAPVLRGAADMHVGMSGILIERNDLAVARQHLQSSRDLGEHLGLAQNPYRWRVAMARIQTAEGDLGAALELLDEAARLYVSDYFPNVRPIAAQKARLWIAQGSLREALGWAREQGLSARDELTYVREFEHTMLARLLLAQSALDGADGPRREAMDLLERLLELAIEGDRTGSAIEILILQALARHRQGDTPVALVSLERALLLAEPEGYVRVFLDEGPPMTALLERSAKHGIARSYVGQLLAATTRPEGATPINQGLIEPLSERELDVLRLLASDLNGPAIAAELVVSLNTVRSHTKSIYAKLGVNDRRAAVRRAEELDLLSRARSRS